MRPRIAVATVALVGVAVLFAGFLLMSPYLALGLFPPACGASQAGGPACSSSSTCTGPPIPAGCAWGEPLFYLGIAIGGVLCPITALIELRRRGPRPG